jgi:hypothetical protein
MRDGEIFFDSDVALSFLHLRLLSCQTKQVPPSLPKLIGDALHAALDELAGA